MENFAFISLKKSTFATDRLFTQFKNITVMKEKIGFNAGLVWNALSESKEKANIKDVKKATKLTEKDLYAALGWLAREEKVNIEEADKEIFISLA